MNMRVKQYEIWLADLNPAIGTEPGKIRPVLIVQTSLLNNSDHPSTITCPVTTNIIPGAEILRVNIPENISGLQNQSSIIIDQLRSIDNRRLIRKTGRLGEEEIEKVKESLSIILDL